MLWLPNGAQQDLKILLSLSCEKIDRIVQSYSKVIKLTYNQDNHDYSYYERILTHYYVRINLQEEGLPIQNLSYSIVALSIICSDSLQRYDLLEGLRTMDFSEEEIQRVDELMDKLRIDGITVQYNSSENANNFLAGWSVHIYHELLHDVEPYTQLIDEICVN
jgi:hypothetical protein